MILKIGTTYINTEAIRYIGDRSYKNNIVVDIWFGDQIQGGSEAIPINTDGAHLRLTDSFAVAFLDWLNTQSIDLMKQFDAEAGA